MPNNELITPEEIKTLRDGAKTITYQTLIDALAKGKVVPVVPLKLKSGYQISMTLDKIPPFTAEHISVYNPDGRTDPADAEIIARAVIGECTAREGMININNIHFIKILDKGT